MIVKIQTPIGGTEGPALIYSKNRSYQAYHEVDSYIKSIMGKEPKRFFHAKEEPDGSLYIEKEAPWQEW